MPEERPRSIARKWETMQIHRFILARRILDPPLTPLARIREMVLHTTNSLTVRLSHALTGEIFRWGFHQISVLRWLRHESPIALSRTRRPANRTDVGSAELEPARCASLTEPSWTEMVFFFFRPTMRFASNPIIEVAPTTGQRNVLARVFPGCSHFSPPPALQQSERTQDACRENVLRHPSPIPWIVKSRELPRISKRRSFQPRLDSIPDIVYQPARMSD